MLATIERLTKSIRSFTEIASGQDLKEAKQDLKKDLRDMTEDLRKDLSENRKVSDDILNKLKAGQNLKEAKPDLKEAKQDLKKDLRDMTEDLTKDLTDMTEDLRKDLLENRKVSDDILNKLKSELENLKENEVKSEVTLDDKQKDHLLKDIEQRSLEEGKKDRQD